MKDAGSIELFRYWNRLRRGRPAPQRAEVEPADIRKLLSDTFILERRRGGEIVFRLAGTRLCSTYGRELKGTSFPSLWRPRDQRLVTRMVGNVFSGATVVAMEFHGIGEKGRACPFELLCLPLDGEGNAPRCLGIVSALEQVFWLGSEAVVSNNLDSMRAIDPEREPLFLSNRPAVPVPALAPRVEDIASSATAALPSPARRVGHLLVFDGGRNAPE